MGKEGRRIYIPDEKTVQFLARAKEEGLHRSEAVRGKFRDPRKALSLTDAYLDESKDVDWKVLARKRGVTPQAVQQIVKKAIVLLQANASPELQAAYPLEKLKIGRVERKRVRQPRAETASEFCEALYQRALTATTDEEARDIIPHVTRGQVQKHRDAYISFPPLAREVGLHWRADKLANLLDFVEIPNGRVEAHGEEGRSVSYRFILPLHSEIAKTVFSLQV